MYHKILVPLDGSKRAEAILPHVEGLAHCTGAGVVLLQVIEPIPVVVDPYDPMPVIPGMEESQAHSSRVSAYLSSIAKGLNDTGIDTEQLVLQGPVVDRITEAADSSEADIIAMASHGRTGLSRVFYGSVAAGILQRVDRPILLVRSREGD